MLGDELVEGDPGERGQGEHGGPSDGRALRARPVGDDHQRDHRHPVRAEGDEALPLHPMRIVGEVGHRQPIADSVQQEAEEAELDAPAGLEPLGVADLLEEARGHVGATEDQEGP